MEHTDFCTNARNDYEDKKASFEASHPNYCRSCRGYGVTSYTYDPSPSGVSLSSGTMTDTEPCGECVSNGKCPLCGAVLVCPDDELWCPCGFATDEDGVGRIGLPSEPECFCWEIELDKYLRETEERAISCQDDEFLRQEMYDDLRGGPWDI